jgi:hypothetical protein
MMARIIVTVIFLAALCVVSSTPGVTGTMGPLQAKKCKNAPRYSPCGIPGSGYYCDGHGTCCSPVQTNPSSCQPPPTR